MGQVVGNYLQKSTATGVPELSGAASDASGGRNWGIVAVLPESSPRLDLVAADEVLALGKAKGTRSWRSDEPVVHGFALKCLTGRAMPSVSNGWIG